MIKEEQKYMGIQRSTEDNSKLKTPSQSNKIDKDLTEKDIMEITIKIDTGNIGSCNLSNVLLNLEKILNSR